MDREMEERLLAMVEREQEHRRTQERRMLGSEERARRRGQWMGFIIGLFAIGGVIALIAEGRHIDDASALAGLVNLFVYWGLTTNV